MRKETDFFVSFKQKRSEANFWKYLLSLAAYFHVRICCKLGKDDFF